MLKLNENVNIADLTAIGFKSFEVNRNITEYYFATRADNRAVIISNKTRTVDLCDIGRVDTDVRLHKHIKYQPKGLMAQDGIFALVSGGWVYQEKEN
ncbi:MAG: hypothetical protein NC114_12220 [Ruminococcus flavefaciens]|nr:hypothetical protein [Ruminococcus flavefaciens]